MRRWIKRMVLALVGVATVASALSWWAVRQASQVPEFYTRLAAEAPEQSAQASRRLQADMERLQDDAAQLGSWQAAFSDDEINGWLVEELPKKFPRLLARGASEPRVVIEDGRLLAAAKYKNRGLETVVSCEIEVELTEQPNMLALRVSNLRAGALPLPLSKFLRGITREAAKGEVDVRWDLTDNGPVALATVPSEHPSYARRPVVVESVQLVQGRLVLAGHTGEHARDVYDPRGTVHRFVSYRHRENRNCQTAQASRTRSSSSSLR